MTPLSDQDLAGKRIAIMSWRDTFNPESGGAENYMLKMAEGFRDRGALVTVFTAAYAGAPPRNTHDGMRYVRAGGKLGVYARGMQALLMRKLGRCDVVIDVQNGLPFFTRLVTRKPIIVLVHHVHREQWPVVYPGMTGRIGWWIEHGLSPRLYRSCQYVAVSRATRDELISLGVPGHHIAVVHNGSESVKVPTLEPKTSYPSMCVVGRLVPHKQVEHAIDAAIALRPELPDLKLTVVGGGWWADELQDYVNQNGAREFVELLGHVSEEDKHRVYARSWVKALPSLKEGWGLVIGEAGHHLTPTVAYRDAGGTRESISDGFSGLLADSKAEFVDQLRQVLTDDSLRASLAKGALSVSESYTWENTQKALTNIVLSAMDGKMIAAQDQPAPQSKI